jgi:hypothetical protein
MKPTVAINVTGRADWKYSHSSKTDVAATFRRWQLAYERAWDEAHLENEKFTAPVESLDARRKVRK